MERKKVGSSKLRSVGYDERARVLEVELNDGSVYQYSGVSPELHRRLMSAPSLVSYYQDKIEEEFSRKRLR
ncbi:MAG TPA: KTSC domain-containing protein [Burkholderiales bacterium]|nr:KTSC domain-containing protein [Burkholderiales bacterium]